jgi:hypothetical protein
LKGSAAPGSPLTRLAFRESLRIGVGYRITPPRGPSVAEKLALGGLCPRTHARILRRRRIQTSPSTYDTTPNLDLYTICLSFAGRRIPCTSTRTYSFIRALWPFPIAFHDTRAFAPYHHSVRRPQWQFLSCQAAETSLPETRPDAASSDRGLDWIMRPPMA